MDKFGGIEGVISPQPEISEFKIVPAYHDFIILGCDGIFDRLTNQQVIDTVWGLIKHQKEAAIPCSFHELTG